MSHDCAHLTDVLLGESPWPGDAWVEQALAGCPDCSALHESLHALDAAAAALPVHAPPPALREQTLALVLEEMAPAPRRRPWLVPLAGGLALAAGVLLFLSAGPAPSTAPPALIERGAGERLPEVALKIAVKTSSGIERHRAGHTYQPGDTLVFRASLDLDASVALVRQDSAGTEILNTWQLPAGEHELSVEGGALAWRIEAGEQTARFALLAAPGNREVGELDEFRPRTPDGSATLCGAARASGWACDAHVVEVAP